MTLDLMHLATKQEVSKLSTLTKRELIAYFNNQICILVNNADLIVSRNFHDADAELASAIARSGRKWQKELEALFAERNPDNKGAVEKA